MQQVAANSSVFSSCYPHFDTFCFQAAEPWASSKREHISQTGGAARLLRLEIHRENTVSSGLNLDLVDNYQKIIDVFLFEKKKEPLFSMKDSRRTLFGPQEKREQRRRWLEDLERPEEETEAVDERVTSWGYHGDMPTMGDRVQCGVCVTMVQYDLRW